METVTNILNMTLNATIAIIGVVGVISALII
jgi:hypothetical protein